MSWSGCSNFVFIEEVWMLKILWEGSEEVCDVDGLVKKGNGWNVVESSSDYLNDRIRFWEVKFSFGNEKVNDILFGDCLWKEIEWKIEDKGNDRWG